MTDPTPTQPNDDRKAADLSLEDLLNCLVGAATMYEADKKAPDGKAINEYIEAIKAKFTTSNRQLLQTVLDKLPKYVKSSVIEMDNPVQAFEDGRADIIQQVTAIINEIMGGLV